MDKYTHLGVYGVLIINDQVLLIKKARGPHTGKWDLPGGSLEFGEEPYQTLLREFHEETGLTDILGTIKTAISYTLVHPFRENQLENMHHIGIIYDVKLLSESNSLKSDGDGEDSLGASWINLHELIQYPLTPFVAEIFKINNSV